MAKTEQATNKKSNVSDALHTLAETIHKRSLIVIFSDMMDNSEQQDQLFNSLQHLKHNKNEVLLFHVYDRKTELELDFENRPVEFIDIETAEKIKLMPQEVYEMFKAKVLENARQIMLRCAQLKIDYVRADIQEGVEKVLESYLVKRSKML
jgi:hypothetical protein